MRQVTSPGGDTYVALLLSLALLLFLYILLHGDVHWIRIILAPDPSVSWQNLRPITG
jgi:hypothetical protein